MIPLLLPLLACAGAKSDPAALHGTRPDAPMALPEFRATAQDGSPRDRAALLGKPTALWFYPAANTPG